MTLKNSYTVFDTNAYRELTYGRSEGEVRLLFTQIREAEAQRDIYPGLSLITAMEILSHLADERDPAFENCRQAAVAAGVHILRHPKEVSYVPPPQVQLEQLIFGNIDESEIKYYDTIADLINWMQIGPVQSCLGRYHEHLKAVKQITEQHKADFKQTLATVLQGIDPAAQNWVALSRDKAKRKRLLAYLNQNEAEVLQILALGYVNKTLAKRQATFGATAKAIAVIDVITYFQTALQLHLAILKKLLIGGFNLDNRKGKRVNTIWDIYQLFCVSAGTVNDRMMILVTGDKWLHDIASESGLASKILTLPTYLSQLGIVP